MKKLFHLLFILSLLSSYSQQNVIPDYDLAAKFSPKKIAKLVHSTSVNPHWLKAGDKFWYQYKTTEGSNYYLVDPNKKVKKKLFDNDKMAAWLTEFTKDPYDAKHLPKFSFKFIDNETAIQFRVTSKYEDEDEDEDEDEYKKEGKNRDKDPSKKDKKKKKVFLFKYVLGTNNLTLLSNKRAPKEDWKKWANIAPDSTVVFYSKKFNLYWMDKENFLKAVKNEKDSTIVENQWTKDGVQHFGYGGYGRGMDNEEIEKRKNDKFPVRGYWSSDSKKFVYQKTDSREIKDLWVINSIAKKRPTLETYKYHMPGEKEYYKREVLIFDILSKEIKKVELDIDKQQYISIFSKPRKPSDYDNDFKPTLLLSEKNKIYFNTISRDRKNLDICVADLNTGKVKVLIKDRTNTYFYETKPVYLIKNESEMIHWSENDGWGHFYRYDSNGNLINRITSGSFHSFNIKHIDSKSNTLYFSAHGLDKNIDPYYEHTYKISLNGGKPKPLNKGDYNTSTSPSDNHRFFVSNFSRVNTIPKSELRNSDGSLVLNLEEADLNELFNSGYQFPEPFKTKADDGITDLYGVMYKPFNFDDKKKYPLLEYVYPGPQTESVNKSFSVRMDRLDRMAQLGFVVITLGNRGGHPHRSKWYHNYGYGNLRDYGLADKKYVAEQLADKHPFIDINKVGIYGHSGGGFMSTAAILVYPDFFKAAYSQAGNHDNSMYNSWWSETHHGVKEKIEDDGTMNYLYEIEKNQSLANNLKGKLFLVTGDMDNNVHPGATIRVANALIKANKRFDLMILPTQRHGFGNMSEYNFWLRADHFSKHLLGLENNEVDIKMIQKDLPKTN
ncbi:prolyl oligopeptidase family serine peptidase [Flavobacteriaceae bacterium]|nr:prolyl oligopeptidase family serine peptidase [Flavobacteriaceae bacterium]